MLEIVAAVEHHVAFGVENCEAARSVGEQRVKIAVAVRIAVDVRDIQAAEVIGALQA